MSDIDPQQAARMAMSDADDAAGAMPGDISAPPESGNTAAPASSLVDGLLETQPAATLGDYPNMPDWAGHAVIGTTKFVNGISGDRDMLGGKPAIVDYVQAVISFYADPDSSSSNDSNDDGSDRDIGQVAQ